MNKESQSLNAEDFCSHYGISQEDVQIVKTEDIMKVWMEKPPEHCRSLILNGNEIFAQALYNDGDEKAQADKGIRFLFESGKGKRNNRILQQ